MWPTTEEVNFWRSIICSKFPILGGSEGIPPGKVLNVRGPNKEFGSKFEFFSLNYGCSLGKILKLWRFYPFAPELLDYRAFSIGPFIACIVCHYSYHSSKWMCLVYP